MLGLPFRVLSPTGTSAGASPCKNPLGVWAPTTHTGTRATCRGYHTRLRPPGDSSPPWRRSSHEPFRPYFMPERPWGSPFKAFPPGRCRTCFQADALVPLRKPLPLFSSEVEKRTRGVDRLQSFYHLPDPYLPNEPKYEQQADAFVRFRLPRVFSPPAAGTAAPNFHVLQRPTRPRRGPRQ
jgi:hypothetical protein